MYEFHIAAHIRKFYNFFDSLFDSSGNIVFANFVQVRNFVFEYNKDKEDSKKLNPGIVNAAGLLDEIFHFVIHTYGKDINPDSTKKALGFLEEKFGNEKIYDFVFDFASIFQPKEVYKHSVSVSDYLNASTAGRSNFEITLEEIILLHLDNYNRANKSLKELINEEYLSNKEVYKSVMVELDKFYEKQPKFGPDNQPLFTMLKTPLDLYPEDIEAQLNFIQEKWGVFLGEELLNKLLKSKDFVKENRVIEMGWGGPAPTVVPRYKGDKDFSDTIIGRSGYNYGSDSLSDYEEIEKFTKDIEWMPRVILMAKNIHVWLDQLSKKYERHIHRLDQIPDEEIDQLVKWGFTGLWLIGLWERSDASKKIKHIMGNIDAVASAYSLFDYEIAHTLGGEEAYDNFNRRAKERGLRLASDMVPNHTGIFSRWILEHPEYFIQSDFPPFPNYTFHGTDLSDDPKVQLRIEDGYWEKRDAAVVFQRIDNHTGEVKYFYHGNDGTNMPWNDTAQLNLLREDVREAVIQKIFDVASKFSIIRFDAAMTLTKKHFSRLWYPQPGTGGDIPSRADYAMTRQDFDAHFPKEFWREVVDRINDKMPETLLLAEAFWLMEGYFVRTLGMHRVYNSAFMHMQMREENEKYRDLISNTLEFEPEILKRYVNFMSNPDEETAIKQFGTDDKYFGVLLLMVTLPGLPMFGHGQVEGFTEKYGMEYQRAYYNETPKDWLVERHEREIFPLMKKRYMFAGVDDFWLFDFIDTFGHLNENVFAYVNGYGREKALVLYNNKYEGASGHLKHSTTKLVADSSGLKKAKSINLAEALNVENSNEAYYYYREQFSGKEYLTTGADIFNNGFHYQLNGFEYRLFWDIRKLEEESSLLRKVKKQLGVYGSDNLFEHIVRVKYENLFTQVKKVFSESINLLTIPEDEKTTKLEKSLTKSYEKALSVIMDLAGFTIDKCDIKYVDHIGALRELLKHIESEDLPGTNLSRLVNGNLKDGYRLLIIIPFIVILKSVLGDAYSEIFNQLYLGYVIRDLLYESGKGDLYVRRKETIIHELAGQYELLTCCKKVDNDKDETKTLNQNFKKLFSLLVIKNNIKDYLQVNEYKGIKYFSKESFEEFVLELLMLLLIREHLLVFVKNEKNEISNKVILGSIRECDMIYREIIQSAEKCEFNFDKLLESETDGEPKSE
jgi:glycosidase